MSNENLEITNNFTQPDPAWDYYPVWHQLIHLKTKIDNALKVVEASEDRTSKIDHQLRHELVPACNLFDSLVRSLDTTEEEFPA